MKRRTRPTGYGEFDIDVHIRHVPTGEVRVHFDRGDYSEWAPGTFSAFIWEEGNFSCDCNRALFFHNWSAESELRGCGHGEYAIDKIIRVDTGETVYSEVGSPT